MPVELKKEQILSLAKKAAFQISAKGLDDQKATVHAVLDISGSMQRMYANGTVQNILSRMLALAMKFDDDGQIDVHLFGTNYYQMPSVGIEDIEGYIKREVLSKHRISEGTEYAKALKPFLSQDKPSGFRKLFTPKAAASNIPSYVLFFTDGDNSDKAETTRLIKELAPRPVFFQFVGIGRESFSYLNTLNTLEGRVIDNTGFMKVEDIDSMNDTALFSEILNEFPEWITKSKAQGILQ